MADPLTLYLVAVAGTLVFFVGAFVYYEAAAAPGQTLRNRGLTPGRATGAVVVTFGVVTAFGFLGTRTLGLETDVESLGYTVLAWSLPLLFGLLGVGASYGFGRRWRRLRPSEDVSTGNVTTGAVACTGPVTDERVDTAPVTGRAAVCWSWSVEVEDPHGAAAAGQSKRWATVDGGAGGVRFAVDDGSGRIWVDPDAATLDLTAERAIRLGEGDRPPESFGNPAPDVERNHRDKPREYTETVLTVGDHVAVAGTATTDADGEPIVAGVDAHVAVGTLSTVADRYRRRAVLYALGGVLGIAVGLWGLAGTFGVSLP